jgi:hypothetical protein
MKTLAALFSNLAVARRAADALEEAGIARAAISLAGRDEDGEPRQLDCNGAVIGKSAAAGAAVGLAAGIALSFIPGIGPVLAVGPLSAVLAGASIGAAAGGLVGALVGWGIPEVEAQHFAEGIRRGGALVTVQVHDDEHAIASMVIERHGPLDLETLSAGWRADGSAGLRTSAEVFDGEAHHGA